MFYIRNLNRQSHMGKKNALKRTIFKIIALIVSLYVTISPIHAQETKKILAFGDSLFSSNGLDEGDSFPDQLETNLRAIGHSVEVISAGFENFTTERALAVIDEVLDDKPDIDMVMFIFGGNDYFEQVPTDFAHKNMDLMLEKITSRDIPTIMAGLIIPYNGYLGFSDRLNEVYTDLADKYQVVLDPFFLEGLAGVSELNQSDGIHPNKFGNSIIAGRISTMVSEMLVSIDRQDRVQTLLSQMDEALEKVSASDDDPQEMPSIVPVANVSENEVNILIVGDSLVAGYGLAPELSFPAQLEEKLKELNPNITVHNAGVSGDTSSGGMSRLEWVISSYPDLDLVVLLFGGNDALRGIHPDLTRRNMDKMTELLKNKNIPTLIAGMVAPPNLGQVYGNNFNSIYPEVAKKHGAALYPFYLDGVAGEIELNQNDRIHPNADGVAYIVERISPMIYELVDNN